MDYQTGEQALNAAIMEHPWMDFYLVSYDEVSVIVRGTLDITQGYQLQIEFTDVGYIDCPIAWKTDTESEVFSKPDPSTLPEETRQRFFDNNAGEVYRFVVSGFSGPWFAHIVASTMRFYSAKSGEYLKWGAS
ncbi:hypothetical protein [Variovorax boronicumulans]|uniref:hypothetical protein n=1 Tax=Variovorax boronicumulans TaxID=436515 RepID=UPI0033979CED